MFIPWAYLQMHLRSMASFHKFIITYKTGRIANDKTHTNSLHELQKNPLSCH